MAVLHMCLLRCCSQAATPASLQMCGVSVSSCTHCSWATTLSLTALLFTCSPRYAVATTRCLTTCPSWLAHSSALCLLMSLVVECQPGLFWSTPGSSTLRMHLSQLFYLPLLLPLISSPKTKQFHTSSNALPPTLLVSGSIGLH